VAEDEARRLGLPVYAYVDDVTYPPSWVPSIPGVEVIPTIQAYPYRAPGGDMRPLPETIASIAATVLTMRKEFTRVAVVMAAYRQIKTLDPPTYNWPLADVLALQAAVWDLCRQAGVQDVLVFVWTRGEGKDGVVSRPEFRGALARMRAAARPVPVPSPAPTPVVSVEMFMSALTLKKSKFARGSFDPLRFIYPLGNGKNLSIDEATGQPRSGGMEATGPSESFLYTPGSGKAEVDFGSHLYTFLVDETR
jgi:hypothetical protein